MLSKPKKLARNPAPPLNGNVDKRSHKAPVVGLVIDYRNSNAQNKNEAHNGHGEPFANLTPT